MKYHHGWKAYSFFFVLQAKNYFNLSKYTLLCICGDTVYGDMRRCEKTKNKKKTRISNSWLSCIYHNFCIIKCKVNFIFETSWATFLLPTLIFNLWKRFFFLRFPMSLSLSLNCFHFWGKRFYLYWFKRQRFIKVTLCSS